MGEFKYKAFISYSHKDKLRARWLHRRLETYAFPKHAIGKQTKFGTVPKNLKPIFRDRDELAAADDLGKKIESALSQSENLIIICSPAAAGSHWVNQEILYFKRHNRGAKIFSVIVEGEPFATGMSGRATEECLPPALRLQVNEAGKLTNIPAEPLAADLRSQGDGKRLGLLKLISGMAGLGLDDLVQRDLQRARRRVTAITVGAISAVLLMGSLTWFALDARQEAETRRAEAEARTESAEELIEFMVTDLKEKLEPVGRLEALKVVGEQASQYYDQYPITAHDDDALGRRARVFHFLGEIQRTQGNTLAAAGYFRRAHNATEALLARNPENPERIFEHAQSAFYVGNLLWNAEEYAAARPYFDEYIEQAEALNAAEPNSLRSLQEITYAYHNLGTLLYKQGDSHEAYDIYLKSIPAFQKIAATNPGNIQYKLDLADAYGWLADASVIVMNSHEAFRYRLKQKEILSALLDTRPTDSKILHDNLTSSVGLGYLALDLEKVELAEEIADQALPVSKALWEGDPSNVNWVKNYGFLQLLKMKVSVEDSNLCQDLAGELVEFEIQAARNIPKDEETLKRLTANRLSFGCKLTNTTLNKKEAK